MEEPHYADIHEAELKEIEAELGHPVTRELAQWFIRNRMNREAIDRMLKAADRNAMERDPDVQNVPNIKEARGRKPVTLTKKCA